MKIESIPLYDQLPLGGATHVIDVSHEDLTETTDNTAQTLVPANFAAGDVFQLVSGRLVETFENTADSAHNTTTLSVGDNDSATRFLASTQINENGSTVETFAGALTAPCFPYNGAKELRLAFGSQTSKKLSNINKGRLLLYVRKVDSKKFGPYT
jgi:hypothetical protein